MAEKDFVVGNGKLDSMIIHTMESCASKGVMPLDVAGSNVSSMLITDTKKFERTQKQIASGKVLLKSGNTMLSLVIGGDSSKLPQDAVAEFYTTLQGQVAKLPDVENPPSVLEFVDAALKQCEAFRVPSVVASLNAVKGRILSTVMSTGNVAQAKSEDLELEALPSIN